MSRTGGEANAGRAATFGIGFPVRLRKPAAELYWDAFGRKLGPALGPRERGVAVLERALDPSRAVAAIADGELVGIAGFHLGEAAFLNVRFKHMAAEFGWARGAIRMLPLALLHRAPQTGELLMGGIVVRADQRGGGLGTQLLRHVYEVARANKLTTVRLDVIDTNPDARRLYEREGFVSIQTVRMPYLRRWLGFSAAATMVRHIEKPDEDPAEAD